jgi:hypothetical protein
MIKALRKLVGGDSTVPISDAYKLDDDAVLDVFLKYHAKLLKSYRDYLEAPSDLVVDKFDKAKFVAEHPEKCKFLTDWMDTQMFQCFVDDRYEGGGGAAKGKRLTRFGDDLPQTDLIWSGLLYCVCICR